MSLKGALYRKLTKKPNNERKQFEFEIEFETGTLKKVGIVLAIIFFISIIGAMSIAFSPTGKITKIQPIETTTTIKTSTTTKATTIPTTTIQPTTSISTTIMPTTTTIQQTTTTIVLNADHISSFSVYKDGDIYEVSFSLENKDGRGVAENGHLSFKILDNAGKAVYEKEADVKKDDFKVFYRYEWTVPFSEVKKSVYSTGKATLIFTTTDNRELSSTDDYVTIPKYSDEEIKAIYENQYSQSAKAVEQTIRGDFEVTLVKVGYFTHLKYDTSGDEVTDFRADIEVKNIGAVSESFSTYDAAMVVGSDQYSRSYRSEFDGSNIYPNVIKTGYILYENVPTDLTGQAQIIIGSSYFMSIDYYTWMNVLYAFNVTL